MKKGRIVKSEDLLAGFPLKSANTVYELRGNAIYKKITNENYFSFISVITYLFLLFLIIILIVQFKT